MPMDGGNQQNSNQAIAATAITLTTVILWPATWTSFEVEGESGTEPYPGQPCSDFELYAGETTFKHIQGDNNNAHHYRCVSMNAPIRITTNP
jgi:hypothetical protein